MAERLRQEGVEIITLSPGETVPELGKLLKEREVEVVVVDGFEGTVPSDINETFGEAVMYPSHRESAPLEVIETSNRLKAAAVAPVAPSPREKEEASAESASALPPFEQEWAEALNIDYKAEKESPKEESAEVTPEAETLEPPRFEVTAQPYNPQPQQPYNPQPQQPYGPQPGPSYSQQPAPYGSYGGDNRPHEPMPDNYLVWSVVLTILCCLIPGIVAIIYSSSVSTKYYAGDIEGAKRASRNAQIWCIIAVVAGILWATLYLPLTLFLS